MVQQQNYGAKSLLILVGFLMTLSLSGCSLIPTPEPKVQVVTKVEKVQIPTVTRPKPVQLIDTKVYVVTEENLQDFLVEFKEIHGDVAYVALSMRDYENLALNIAELKRFINQQTQVIIYYENAVSDSINNSSKSDQPQEQ